MEKPRIKPNNPNFSSGPCAKRPGWSIDNLDQALTGRSHRSGSGKEKLKAVIDQHREILHIPADYHIGIVPASDTGAVETALWNLLGARGVDVLAWESFGQDWMKDITGQLKLDNVTTHEADYGALPDLSKVNFANDVVFCWNGTTSGVRVPHGDWIPADREGLTICDATSAVFAYDMPWDKLDVVTWSWQKVLGGEAAHGMLVLSPRAVARLESYTPSWPLPKIFRITKGGQLNEGIFQGLTINTPSMIAVEDCLDALAWVKSLGGVEKTIERSKANHDTLMTWASISDWAQFLTPDPNIRSTTSMTLKIIDSWFDTMDIDGQTTFVADMCKLLDKEGVAYDIKHYRSAPPGLRIWGGATIESGDIEVLTAWLDWAYESVKTLRRLEAA